LKLREIAAALGCRLVSGMEQAEAGQLTSGDLRSKAIPAEFEGEVFQLSEVRLPTRGSSENHTPAE
jgi:hypothetical protein